MSTKSRKEISLELTPADAIIFRGNFQSAVTTSIIDLKNPTEGTVAYKVKTTAPRRYCVRPNSGKLVSGETQQVKILLQPNQNNEDLTKHKFLLQTMEITAQHDEIPVDDLFKDKQLTEVASSKKLVCKFEMTSDPPAYEEVTAKNNSNGEGEGVSIEQTARQTPEKQQSSSNSNKDTQESTSITAPPRPKISAVPTEPKVMNQSVSNPKTTTKTTSSTKNSNNFTASEEYQKMKDTINSLQEKLKAASVNISVSSQQVQRDQNQASIMYKAIILVAILAFLFGFFINGMACKC